MPTPLQWSYSWLTWVGVCEFCLFLELPKWFWCTARLQNHQCVISVPIYIISPAYRHRCMCAYIFHTSGKIQGNESICGYGCPYRRQMRPWSAAEGTQILHFKTTFFIVFEFFSMCGHWCSHLNSQLEIDFHGFEIALHSFPDSWELSLCEKGSVFFSLQKFCVLNSLGSKKLGLMNK